MGKPKVKSVSGNAYNRLGNRNHIENLSFYQAADYDANVNTVEDMANALIRFENGASLAVDVSFALHLKQDEISVRLFGDKGGAEVEPKLLIMGEKHNTILNMTPQIDHLSFDFERASKRSRSFYRLLPRTHQDDLSGGRRRGTDENPLRYLRVEREGNRNCFLVMPGRRSGREEEQHERHIPRFSCYNTQH